VDSVRTAMGSLLSLCNAASRRRSALRISPDESSSAQANGVLLLTMIGLSKTLVSHTRAPACCNAYTPCQRMQLWQCVVGVDVTRSVCDAQAAWKSQRDTM